MNPLTPASVLASPYHLHLLWPPLTRPPLPRLLSATLLPPPRRILRTLTRAFLVASPLRRLDPPLPFPPPFHPLPRLRPEQ